MKTKLITKKIATMAFTVLLTTNFIATTAFADSFKVVTLGANLTKQQKEEMLKYFNVNKDDADIIEVTNAEEQKYLGGSASKSEIGTRSISCSYVDPSSKDGLKVSTHNITWVTESMIKNALITAGVENADVKVNAPFKVSGTAALTGILKGFEKSEGGKKISDNKKKVANEELMVTGKLGDKIGKDNAAKIVNEVKKDVVKEKPKTEQQIRDIIINVTNNYGQKLSKDQIDSLTKLMNKINGLNLNFSQLKNQFNSIANELKGSLNSPEAQGFFNKLWNAISNFFNNLFK